MAGSSVVLLDLVVPVAVFGLKLELDEALDLVLPAGGELLVLPQELVLALAHRAARVLIEEVGDVHLEDRQDLEERLEAGLVLAVFHATKIGLLDVDAMGQIGLRESPVLAK